MDIPLHYLSATEALRAFKEKRLSPVELMDAVIARHESVNDTINCFAFTFFEEAREQARAAEQAYANRTARPLEGLPVAIKDEQPIAGQPLTNGSLIWKDNIAQDTAQLPARVMAAGGIVHARTTTPEFSAAAYTWSKLWGVTRNPWNPEITVGGSSGGSGASLAAGTSTLASGSDIGGSIRIPAAYNGVVGYRAPHGRVPGIPPFNLISYATDGGLARTVDDMIVFQNVIAGPDPHDHASLKPKLILPNDFPDLRGVKIAYNYDLGLWPLSDSVRRNFDASMALLRDLGAETVEVDLGWDIDRLEKAAFDRLSFWMGTYMNDIIDDTTRDQLCSYNQFTAAEGATVTNSEVMAAYEVEAEMYASFGPLMEDHLVLITPTMTAVDTPADYDPDPTVMVAGKQRNAMLENMLTYPFNMLNMTPVLSVPNGRADNGVPTSLQIIGPTHEDGHVFRVAKALEQATGPFISTERFPDLG
jgi:amidase